MIAKHRVPNINHRILRQCREQIGLDIEEAQSKVTKTLGAIEEGKENPTFRQLEKLAELYRVPQWVFLRDSLPERYDFEPRILSFRRAGFNDPTSTDDHKIRVITVGVERFRELVLELRTDMGETIEPFSPPSLDTDIPRLARTVRGWLGHATGNHDFEQWKQTFEAKDIFVFLTGKYSGWSKVEASLRGFSIHKETLPIIVINDSDAKAAQSFTLFHELGHLLHKESVIDAAGADDLSHLSQQKEEKWCNELAGEILMPKETFSREIPEMTGQEKKDLGSMDRVAGKFKVSSYACAVRMFQLQEISQQQFSRTANWLNERYERTRQQGRHPVRRNIPREKFRQYGGIYSRAVVQAYRNQEIGLHKLCKLFGFKRAVHAKELEKLV